MKFYSFFDLHRKILQGLIPCVKKLARTVNLLVYTYALFTAGNLLNYSFLRDFCHFVST